MVPNEGVMCKQSNLRILKTIHLISQAMLMECHPAHTCLQRMFVKSRSRIHFLDILFRKLTLSSDIPCLKKAVGFFPP